MISGGTRLAAIIGDPVRHSLSPVLHNTAYAELGLDWIYLAFSVPAGETRAALDAVRALDLVGLSVTMPHKTAAADGCDELSADAAALHSVNTVTRMEDGRLHGDSTDGEGFVRSVQEAGHELAGATALVLGAGGSARVVARALGQHGVAVTIAARRPEAAADAAARAGATTAAWTDRDACARASAIVVNATPLGMDGAASGALPLDGASLARGAGGRRPRVPPTRNPAAGCRSRRGRGHRRRSRHARAPGRAPDRAVVGPDRAGRRHARRGAVRARKPIGNGRHT